MEILIDITRWVGTHEWQVVTAPSGDILAVPDLNWIARVIFLLVMVYWLIKSIMHLTIKIIR